MKIVFILYYFVNFISTDTDWKTFIEQEKQKIFDGLGILEAPEYHKIKEIEKQQFSKLLRNHGIKKRNSQTCDEYNCCVTARKVTFEEIGLEWIISPSSYLAQECEGPCSIKNLNYTPPLKTYLRILHKKSCCVPYEFEDMNVVIMNGSRPQFKQIKDLLATKCRCV
ncbi:transforming growth factor beta-3 proprotein-like [Octopus sinensis]|uniref:Transforming growth factor beta-3 proprotein-like n=1 Tax=Octopus sinensis TaxID=2607531 RepID=A0A6P7TZR7_9MOLL|nr:transforming growth factor beta-3 proprotein-like [Octopus sinensis]